MFTFFIPLLWPSEIITFFIIRAIIRKPIEPVKHKWRNSIYFTIPVFTLFYILLWTWSAMFDNTMRGNGSAMGAALVVYSILLFASLVIVIWPATKKIQFPNKTVKILLIILILLHYFPVIREDIVDSAGFISSGRYFGISQKKAEECTKLVMGSNRVSILNKATKEDSEWELTYRVYGKNGKEYLDQETYFVNARLCTVEKLNKGNISNIRIEKDGQIINDAEILLMMSGSEESYSNGTYMYIFDYQVTNSQGNTKLITQVDNSYVHIDNPVFYLTIIDGGQIYRYKLPDQYKSELKIDLNRIN